MADDYAFELIPCVVCGSEHHELLTESIDVRIGQKISAVSCAECGLVFLNPSPTEADYIRFYQTRAGRKKSNSKTARTVMEDKRFEAPLLTDFISRNVDGLSSFAAIDVGTGWGGFLPYLKPLVRSLYATELMPLAVEFITTELGVECRQCARIAEGFPGKTFDLITAVAVIEHYPDPLSALSDWYDALADDGYLLLFTPDVNGLIYTEKSAQYFKFVHPYYYSPATLELLLNKAGFETVAVWSSEPSVNLFSVRKPSLVASAEMMVIARKSSRKEIELNGGADLCMAMKNKVQQAECLKEQFLTARTFWLHPLTIPLRAISKMVPVYQPNHYEDLARQYWQTFDARRMADLPQSYSKRYETWLSRLFLNAARRSANA